MKKNLSKFRDWDDIGQGALYVEARQSALDQLSDAFEAYLNRGALDSLISSHLGSYGDVRIHEYRIDQFEVDLEWEGSYLKAVIKL